MRCSRTECRHRFTLKRNPHDYKRWPKCPSCGDPFPRSDEANRRRELEAQDTCRCNAYSFPHRKGSLRACIHHPLADKRMTLEEERHWEDIEATPRGSAIPKRYNI